VTYDRRGHSQSERPNSPESIQQDVADLAALLEELDLAPAHMIGHSLGGSIVLRLAVERAELFRSMVVHEPPLFNLLKGDAQEEEMLENILARLDVVVRLLEADDREGGAQQFVDTIAFAPGTWAQLPPEMKRMVTFNAPTFLDEARDPETISIDPEPLRRFPHPVLLTLGAESPPFFPSIVEKVARVLPQAERKTFAEAGHEPEYSHPELYAATITEFVTRVIA
jgi:pimeloyl-ACP methyl ester carboxylesterase